MASSPMARGSGSAAAGTGGSQTVEQSLLNKMLVESGERAKLKEYVMTTLSDCGWREELKRHCVEYIQNKGIEKVTIEEITSDIAPKGRATVPDSLKTELLNRLRVFAEEQGMESAAGGPISAGSGEGMP
mmetsp:Transcript_50653/g.127616  ORF Transcript_50653/g.127616 Transcript_50653/m.127616 type:complete len:130 (-) Transcript_50653:22-411(-)